MAIQMGGVLRYKMGVLTVVLFPLSVGAPESTAIQLGGKMQYKSEVHCDTFLRSSGGRGF